MKYDDMMQYANMRDACMPVQESENQFFDVYDGIILKLWKVPGWQVDTNIQYQHGYRFVCYIK